MSIRVSIDASGGDFGFSVTINAGISALKTYDDLLINFVGDEAGIKNELNKNLLIQILLIVLMSLMPQRLSI